MTALIPQMTATERDRLRRRSKRLFGNADRLQVAYAVAKGSGVVHAQELAGILGISPPRVRSQLLAFCEAGVMEALPRTELKQHYARTDDPFWDLVTQLVDGWG